MESVTEIILVGVLGVVIYQDFKFRAVSWIVFPVLMVIALIVAQGQLPIIEVLESSMINLAFVALMLFGLTLYYSVKQGTLINIVNKYIGIADLLLLVVIALLFSPVNFIVYYVLSLILITTGSIVYLIAKKNVNAEIPLAGAFSIVLIACFLFAGITGNVNFYDDGWMMELLHPFMLST